MVMIKSSIKDFSIDGYLNENLQLAKEAIKKDWDMIFVVDGPEGSGKSTIAQQAAFVCDDTLILDRIVFTPKEFQKAVKSANKYEAIIYDEAYTGLSSRATMSLINRTLIKMLAEIRQRNLFIFIVCPTYFDLDKYVALWRSRALIHVYTHGFDRGYFSFYNMDLKKSLYIEGKKYYSYYKPKPNFIGRFVKTYVVPEQEYREKKRNSLIKREADEEERMIINRVQEEIMKRIMTNKDIPDIKKAEIIGIHRSTYYARLKKYEEDGTLELWKQENEETDKKSVETVASEESS